MENEGVVELLARAAKAVEDAAVPEDLRAAAFTAAVEALSGGSAASGAARDGGGREPAVQTGSPLLDAVAAGLDLDGRSTALLFAEQNGEPVLRMKPSRLPDKKASAARDIMLLVLAARQLGGVEESTSSEVLQEACRKHGKLDKSNFSRHIAALDNYVSVEGRGRNVGRKLNAVGVEEASKLAATYAAEE